MNAALVARLVTDLKAYAVLPSESAALSDGSLSDCGGRAAARSSNLTAVTMLSRNHRPVCTLCMARLTGSKARVPNSKGM